MLGTGAPVSVRLQLYAFENVGTLTPAPALEVDREQAEPRVCGPEVIDRRHPIRCSARRWWTG